MRTHPHTALAFDWHALKTEDALVRVLKAEALAPKTTQAATIAVITGRLK